jgi:hypothetical protein
MSTNLFNISDIKWVQISFIHPKTFKNFGNGRNEKHWKWRRSQLSNNI